MGSGGRSADWGPPRPPPSGTMPGWDLAAPRNDMHARCVYRAISPCNVLPTLLALTGLPFSCGRTICLIRSVLTPHKALDDEIDPGAPHHHQPCCPSSPPRRPHDAGGLHHAHGPVPLSTHSGLLIHATTSLTALPPPMPPPQCRPRASRTHPIASTRCSGERPQPNSSGVIKQAAWGLWGLGGGEVVWEGDNLEASRGLPAQAHTT